MSIGTVCSRVVVTGTPGESILAVTRRMEEQNVGSVVLVSDQGRPLGIVTDRDVAIRCVARGLVAQDTPVASIMSRELRTIEESTPLDQALPLMARSGTRRLVVTDAASRLVGILTLDDMLELLVAEVGSIATLLRKESPLQPVP